MKLQLPQEVQEIIETLEAAGFEAYAVGGCVRDALLGKEPKDWDITTSALPEEMKALFPKTIDTGIQHGTVTIRKNHQSFETTTYRMDGKYSDHRHPDTVEFTPNLSEDLKRRDFTMNAMAYSPSAGLVDLYNGEEDLQQGIIRCVGDPKKRFTEDALRMLRGIRFSAQLDFSIEEETLKAMKELAPTISVVSAERIFTELRKMLLVPVPEHSDGTSALAKALRLLYETGISKVIFPEWDHMITCDQENINHAYTVAEHTIRVVENIPPVEHLRFLALLHDVAKPVVKTRDEFDPEHPDKKLQCHFQGHPEKGAEMTKEILSRWKVSNDLKNRVSHLVLYHDDRYPLDEKHVRRQMARMGVEYYPDFLTFRRADVLGQSTYRREEKVANIQKETELFEAILNRGDCVQISDLAINGADLKALGVPAGPMYKRILEKLLEDVVDAPEKNNREYLLKRSRKLLQNWERRDT